MNRRPLSLTCLYSKLKESQLPRIQQGDPVARYFGLKRRQVSISTTRQQSCRKVMFPEAHVCFFILLTGMGDLGTGPSPTPPPPLQVVRTLGPPRQLQTSSAFTLLYRELPYAGRVQNLDLTAQGYLPNPPPIQKLKLRSAWPVCKRATRIRLKWPPLVMSVSGGLWSEQLSIGVMSGEN